MKKIKKNVCHHPYIRIISVLAWDSGYVFETPGFHKLSNNKWYQLFCSLSTAAQQYCQ
jgi:hypothetical protein